MNLWLIEFPHPSIHLDLSSLAAYTPVQTLLTNCTVPTKECYNQCLAGITFFFSMTAAPVFSNYFFQRTWIFFAIFKILIPFKTLFFSLLLHILFLLFSYWSSFTTSGGRVLLFFSMMAAPVFSNYVFSKNLDDFSIFKISIPFKILFFPLFHNLFLIFHIGRLII